MMETPSCAIHQVDEAGAVEEELTGMNCHETRYPS